MYEIDNDAGESHHENITEYASDPEYGPRPFTLWAHDSISVQMMWTGDDLGLMVEVLDSYEHFDELEVGDDVRDAAGELKQIGTTFAELVGDAHDTDVDLPLEAAGKNEKGIVVKIYQNELELN